MDELTSRTLCSTNVMPSFLHEAKTSWSAWLPVGLAMYLTPERLARRTLSMKGNWGFESALFVGSFGDMVGKVVMTYEGVGGESYAFEVAEPFFPLFGGDCERGLD